MWATVQSLGASFGPSASRGRTSAPAAGGSGTAARAGKGRFSCADTLYAEDMRKTHVDVDRLFGVLMAIQWPVGVVLAMVVSPYTWIGDQSRVHTHVWAATFLGAALSGLPLVMIWTKPGSPATRHVIAVAQMLWSALLIHLTGGRIETHFHVFGSLAFLAFYRDWTVIITATVVVAADHFVRGVWWPQSVFGVAVESPYRWMEHAVWVAFEDVILIRSCLRGRRQARAIAEREAELSIANDNLAAQNQERRRAEAEVRRLYDDLTRVHEEAMAAGRVKSQFVANMSHELRTPLNAIIGYSELLQLPAARKDDAAYMADLERIHKAGKHLLTLINDILDISKIEEGKLQLETEVFDARSILEDVEATIRPLAERSANTLELMTGDRPAMISADGMRLKQCLLNLLSNACKFTQSGVVTFSILREPREQGDAVVLRVTDTGIGISEEQAARLFQPFTQADASTTRQYGGTGLGLAITKNLVEAMGGKIGMTSRPGVGSTFTIEFPAAPEGA